MTPRVQQAPHPSMARAVLMLKDAGLVLGAFLFINSFVVASMRVPTGSMENEVLAGDVMFVNKMIYGGTTPRAIPFTDIRLPWFHVPGFRHVQRGDIVAFEYPGDRDDKVASEFVYYLKRCVALPGDIVEIKNRVVFVNGVASPMPRNMKFLRVAPRRPGWGHPEIFPPGSTFNEDYWGPIRVPARGDTIHLSPATITRWATFIRREHHEIGLTPEGSVTIDGSPTTTYVVRRDYLFGMGDNRDDSADSRFWGFIPEENVAGSPVMVYWSINPDISWLDPVHKLGSIRWGRIGALPR